MKEISERKSVRTYSDRPIEEENIRKILQAGMSGPSACNARPWYFVVVTDPEQLNRMADANGRAAEPLRKAKMAVLACGDLERAIKRAPEYWVVDCSIACQNMILEAQHLGIGSVWIGTWPQQEKIKGQAELFGLPETVVPHSVVAFGYPSDDVQLGPRPDKPEFEEDRIHFEKW